MTLLGLGKKAMKAKDKEEEFLCVSWDHLELIEMK